MTDNIEPQEVTQPGPYGWVCPICHRVWALWVRGCDNCNRPIIGFSTGTTNISYTKQEVTQ